MKKYYSLIFVLFIVLPAFAQQQHREVGVRPVIVVPTPIERDLEAQFTADVTSGPVPLTVHFTDQSTGGPTSWNWDFGDGASDTLQNPVHAYTQNGVYTVKLTISNGSQFYALEKKNFITVTINYTGCDTLHCPLPEPLTYYLLTKNNVPLGYVSGNNTFGDKAIADFIENTSADMLIKGAMIEFSYAKQAALNDENIIIKAWKYDNVHNQPGSLLGSASVSLSSVISDVAALRPTQVLFDPPLQVDGPFFLGVSLPSQTGDTLVLWTTQSGAITPNTGWVLQSDNKWSAYDSLYTNPTMLVLTDAIYPILCNNGNGSEDHISSRNISITPNPATDFLRVESKTTSLKNAAYDLIAVTGEKIKTGTFTSWPGAEVLDISSCKPGLYFLRISASSGILVKRVVIR